MIDLFFVFNYEKVPSCELNRRHKRIFLSFLYYSSELDSSLNLLFTKLLIKYTINRFLGGNKLTKMANPRPRLSIYSII